MTDTFAGDDRTNHERMLAGDFTIGGEDPESIRLAQRAVKLAEVYRVAATEDEGGARPILDDLIGDLGEDAFVKPPLYVDYGGNITIGARTFINDNSVDPDPRRAKLEAAEPITIGDNVWIGGGAIVLPGVTIGDHTVVGAGAVVTKDLPARVVAVGNPARVVKEI